MPPNVFLVEEAKNMKANEHVTVNKYDYRILIYEVLGHQKCFNKHF
jgi:hypothetical protein